MGYFGIFDRFAGFLRDFFGILWEILGYFRISERFFRILGIFRIFEGFVGVFEGFFVVICYIVGYCKNFSGF